MGRPGRGDLKGLGLKEVQDPWYGGGGGKPKRGKDSLPSEEAKLRLGGGGGVWIWTWKGSFILWDVECLG